MQTVESLSPIQTIQQTGSRHTWASHEISTAAIGTHQKGHPVSSKMLRFMLCTHVQPKMAEMISCSMELMNKKGPNNQNKSTAG